MSMELVSAILKSKSPNQLVTRHLIPKLEMQESQIIQRFEDKTESQGELGLHGRGNIQKLVLTRENSARQMPIQVFYSPRPLIGIKGQQEYLPKVEIGNTAYYRVPRADFESASNRFGISQSENNPFTFGTNKILTFPESIFQRPGWKEKVKIIGKTAFVSVGEADFDAISELHEKITFLNRLKFTLTHLLHPDPSKYAQKMNIPKKDPYFEFVRKNRGNLGFVKKLADILQTKRERPARNQNEKGYDLMRQTRDRIQKNIKRSIVNRFSLSPELAQYYAVIYSDFVGSKSKAALMALSRHIANPQSAKS
ncbi:hypothetical protein HY989_05990 [Candidatus Micrarchaeota archaeon]|nr:hypothetical protein [Candidatus Micrarchaeota archaeon]